MTIDLFIVFKYGIEAILIYVLIQDSNPTQLIHLLIDTERFEG
jgi:hypothetical protein